MASLNGLNDTHDVCFDECLEIGENTTDPEEKVMTPDIQADNATADQETELLYYKQVLVRYKHEWTHSFTFNHVKMADWLLRITCPQDQTLTDILIK